MPSLLLLIEFLDELVFGVTEAAWPLIRDDLGLNYAQIGLALSLPGFFSTFTEPFIGILGDVWKRRILILGGGLFFTLALVLIASSQSYLVFLISMTLFYPSSGAFVSLAQATLMDSDPGRHEQNMARWTLAGSLGVVAGPVLLTGAAVLAIGWRGVYLGLAVLAIALVAFLIPRRSVLEGNAVHQTDVRKGLVSGLRSAFLLLGRWSVMRWLVLLEFSDLMLDILHAFLALYLVDVAGLTPAEAAIAIAVWTGVRLAGDLAIIPLLERVSGMAYLRLSALLTLGLFPLFLLSGNIWMKLILLNLVGLLTAGWYAILKGQLYSAMPGQSGTVMALDNIVGMAGDFLPLGIGFAAQAFGLPAAMWLLLLGPAVLSAGLFQLRTAPRKASGP